MSVKVKDTGEVFLKRFNKGVTQTGNIVAAAGLAKALIVSRTLVGTSSKGTKFPSYTDSYKLWKTGKGHPAATNLSLTGEMLGDIQFKVISPNQALLFFGSKLSQAKAHRHHTGKYPFFGILPKEYAAMHAAILKNIKKLMKEGLS